jgi:Protein of unknown function DUF262/Protein of unknown function (DUF1524)
MDLHAYTKTIFDIFSINKKYVVPRFQREYSWGEDEVSELWRDLVANIATENGTLSNQEYFIGSLVLVGEDKSTEFNIVDGQQRLTTITLLMSALVDAFKSLSLDDLARGLYAFVEGRDVANRQFFKLENENPKPFLQNSIQNYDKVSAEPSSEEETNLRNTYDFFRQRFQKSALAKDFPIFWEQGAGDEDTRHRVILEAIRSQVLTFIKTIYITVGSDDDAYTIFETLNARGMNLSPVDLIKNEIFKTLADEHPADNAKFRWKQLHATLAARDDRLDIDVYVRHFWLSNHEFTTEDKIYTSFKRITHGDKEVIRTALEDLVAESEYYKKMTAPIPADWPQQEEKSIADSLMALNIFRVTQVRTLLLALLAMRTKKLVGLTDLRDCMSVLENFHFLFSAITSSRGSGLERKYSKYARTLRSAKNTKEARKVLADLRIDLRQKVPPQEIVRDGFKKLSYTDDETRQKKLIQYVFRRIELHLSETNEIDIGTITLEHIVPQSDSSIGDDVGLIGNLLPLGTALNNQAGEDGFEKKLKRYKDSKLHIVRDFVAKCGAKATWTKGDISNRTAALADLAYAQIWRV